MSALWPVLAIALFIWVTTRSSRRRRRAGRWEAPPHDEELARLKARVRALEEIVTDRDWRLRRDIDGL